MQEENDRRIDIAAAGAHYQAFQRGQPHRGIDALAVADCGNRCAVAEVAGNHIQLFDRLVQHARRFTRHVVVAGAVEAVAADAVFFIEMIGQGVEVRLFRHRLMESRIENRYVFIRKMREVFQRLFDADQMRRVMQGCERRSVFDILHRLIADDDGVRQLFAAVDDTVTDCSDLCRQLRFLCQNVFNDEVQGFAVRGARTQRSFLFSAVQFPFNARFGQMETFGQT